MVLERRNWRSRSGFVLMLVAAAGLVASSSDRVRAGRGGSDDYSDEINISHARLSDSATRSIESAISNAGRDCGQLARAYRIDCLGSAFTRIAEDVPASPDYREVRTELYRTWRKLRVIVKQNRDAEAPRATVSGRGVPSRGYAAVREANLEAASRAAAAVISEAETKLLRSGEISDRRRSHYRSIATAVGSTRRILRS